jgi:tRNA-dihydrouridine synthase B
LGGPKPTTEERCATVLQHFRAHLEFVGDEKAAVRSFRKHLAWYGFGLRGAAAFRAEVNRLELSLQVQASVKRFFSQAQADPQPEGEQEVDYRAALG